MLGRVEQTSLKVPPAWSEQWEASCPLRHYASDLITWAAATDLEANKQGPAAVLQLGGLARQMAREMNQAELANGRQEVDPNNGQPVHVSGLALLLRQLLRRFGAMDEEQGIHAIAEFIGFRRLPHESIDSTIMRF